MTIQDGRNNWKGIQGDEIPFRIVWVEIGFVRQENDKGQKVIRRIPKVLKIVIATVQNIIKVDLTKVYVETHYGMESRIFI